MTVTPPTPSVPGQRARLRVLVVEDVPTLRRAYAHALLSHGYDVTSVTDGGEALDIVEAARPEVIVVEVMMPIHDGVSMVRLLRVRGLCTPVLMLGEDDFLRDLALRAGADAFLVAPVGPELLLATVAGLADRSRRRPLVEQRLRDRSA